ncbi:hypothetical protein A4X13_0g4865 [Tilletia indica]|uniref:Uncharacterized protein n=1 Tax=Tilletia indica TaxID=43049 RepID=A0A177TQ36_9BASI|nr:hypothetical protein A4X13_0g4865 [Tilletia indica]
MFQTLSRAFSSPFISRSAAAFGASARVQYRPRVAALPNPSQPAASASQREAMVAENVATSGEAAEEVSTSMGVPLIAHGTLAGAPHFHGLLNSIGTLSAPGVRVEVYNDA